MLGKFKKFVKGFIFFKKNTRTFFRVVFLFFQAWAGKCPRLLHFPLQVKTKI